MIKISKLTSKKLRPIIFGAIILYSAFQNKSMSQFIVDTYSNDSSVTYLHVDSSLLVLTFESSYSFQQCSTAVAGTPNLLALDSLLTGPAPNSFKAYLISTPTIAQYNAAKSHLVTNANIVLSIQPVYKNYSGGLIPSDIIIVRLATLADSNFLISDAVANNCQVIGPSGFDPLIWFIKQAKRMDPTPITSSALNTNTTNYGWVETNFIYSVSLTGNTPTDPLYSTQWALKNTGSNYPTGSTVSSGTIGEDINAEDAWNFTKGCNQIKIGIMDEGMDCNHEDYDVFSNGYNALNSAYYGISATSGCYDGVDNLGTHGTHCAGIINSEWNNTGGAGLAPNVELTSIWVVHGRSYKQTDDITLANAYSWALNNDIDILTGSFAIFPFTPTYQLNQSIVNSQIQNFIQNGRGGLGGLIFHSTGNGDPAYHFACSTGGYIGYPASVEGVIAVTGTTPCEELKSCSDCVGSGTGIASHGTGTDIAAPYSEIWTTDHMGSLGGNYTLFSGTSASAPLAAGTMALILSANPLLTHNQARFILESTCDKIGGYTYNSSVTGQPNGDWSFELGYGRIDAGAAVELAMETEVVFLQLNGATVPGNVFMQPTLTFTHALTAQIPPSSVSYVIHWFYNGQEISSGSSSISATKFGEYKFVVKSDCGLTQSRILRIIPDCENISSNLTMLSGTLSSGNYSSLNGYYIPDNTTVTINTISVVFQNTFIAAGECSKIYVPAGGTLNLNNVQVIGCSGWKGIEVDGDQNAPPGSGLHGSVGIEDSYLENAEIGVYSKHGGSIGLYNTRFYKNGIHAAFANYNLSFSRSILATYNEFGPTKATGFTCGEPRGVDYETTYTSSNGSSTSVRPYVLISSIRGVEMDWNTFYDNMNELDGWRSFPNLDGQFSFESPSLLKTGVFGYDSKNLILTNNTIYVHGDCGIHLKNVSRTGSVINTISGNEIGRYFGAVLVPNEGSLNGLRMESCEYFDVNFNQFATGLNYGISVLNSFTQLSFSTNHILSSKYGIVVAPVEWPFTTTNLNTSNTTSMDVDLKCNKFEYVDIAIGISGNLINQGSIGLNAQNKFYNVFDWEVVSRGGWSNNYYYPTGFPNQTPRPFGPTVTIDNTSVSTFFHTGTSTGNTGCYYFKNALALEETEEPIIGIYPNPFATAFTLSAPENSTFEVYDAKGQRVSERCQTFQISPTEWRIDASSLPVGMYLIRISNGSSSHSATLIHINH